jgi:hypothetical protein
MVPCPRKSATALSTAASACLALLLVAASIRGWGWLWGSGPAPSPVVFVRSAGPGPSLSSSSSPPHSLPWPLSLFRPSSPASDDAAHTGRRGPRNGPRARPPPTLHLDPEEDALWLSRSWAVEVGRREREREREREGGAEVAAGDRTSSSFNCVGHLNNASAWRTRACTFRDICLEPGTGRWLYFSGGGGGGGGPAGGAASEPAHPTLFDTDGAVAHATFRFAGHGFVSTAPEPQPGVESLLAPAPDSFSWAPEVIQGPLPPRLVVVASEDDPTPVPPPNPVLLQLFSLDPARFGTSPSPCGLGGLGRLLWDGLAPLYAAKASLGLLTPCDVGAKGERGGGGSLAGCFHGDGGEAEGEGGRGAFPSSRVLLLTDPSALAGEACARVLHLALPAGGVVASAADANAGIPEGEDWWGSLQEAVEWRGEDEEGEGEGEEGEGLDARPPLLCLPHVQVGGLISFLSGPVAADEARRRRGQGGAGGGGGGEGEGPPPPPPTRVSATGREPLLWEFRASVLLRAGLDPLAPAGRQKQHVITVVAPSAWEAAAAEEGAGGAGGDAPASSSHVRAGDLEAAASWIKGAHPDAEVRVLHLHSAPWGSVRAPPPGKASGVVRAAETDWASALPLLHRTTLLLVPTGALAQVTVPFLPVGSASIVVDEGEPSPFRRGGGGGAASVTPDGLPVLDEDFVPLGADPDVASGLARFRSVSREGPLLDAFPHVTRLHYQVRGDADVVGGEGEGGGMVVALRREKVLRLVRWAMESLAAQEGGEGGEGDAELGTLYPRYGGG